MIEFIKQYTEQINKTNEDIGEINGWKEYVSKFNKVNKELFNAIVNLSPYQIRTLKSQYLKNWIKNFQNTHKERE